MACRRLLAAASAPGASSSASTLTRSWQPTSFSRHGLADPALRTLLEVGSRRVHLSGCTYSPTRAWVVQQARNPAWKLLEGELPARFLLRDRSVESRAARRGVDEVAHRRIELRRLAPRAR